MLWWWGSTNTLVDGYYYYGSQPTYAFSFEINEGYDTDNDNLGDFGKVTPQTIQPFPSPICPCYRDQRLPSSDQRVRLGALGCPRRAESGLGPGLPGIVASRSHAGENLCTEAIQRHHALKSWQLIFRLSLGVESSRVGSTHGDHAGRTS